MFVVMVMAQLSLSLSAPVTTLNVKVLVVNQIQSSWDNVTCYHLFHGECTSFLKVYITALPMKSSVRAMPEHIPTKEWTSKPFPGGDHPINEDIKFQTQSIQNVYMVQAFLFNTRKDKTESQVLLNEFNYLFSADTIPKMQPNYGKFSFHGINTGSFMVAQIDISYK